MSDVVLDKFLKGLKAIQGQKAPARDDAKAKERQRISDEIANLRLDKANSYPSLNIEPLKLLIRQGASIGEIYRSGDIITIDVKWPNGETSQVFQEVGARDVLVDNGGRNDAVTIRVENDGRQKRYVEEGACHRTTYTSSGTLDTHEEGGALHKFEGGKRVFSEDLGTGKRFFYYEGTDRVAFIEQPDGTVLKKDVFAFDENKQFRVELQPTKYKLAQDQKKLIAKPKLRLRRRLRAYRRKIRTRVKEPEVSGEFTDETKVSKPAQAGQVVVTAGMVLAANPKTTEPLQGMFGLSESLVAAFLRSGSAFGAPTVASSKSSVVVSTSESERKVDEAVVVRVGTRVPVIVMSEGAFLVMDDRADLADGVREDAVTRKDGKDPAKPSKKLKAAMLQAFNKPGMSTAGAPVMMRSGAMPTMRGERYVAPRRAARVFDIKMSSNNGMQSSVFRGSVLSATSGNQYVIPAALPVVMKAAAPVEAKVSVKDAMREMLVKKADRGSRDSGNGSNPQQGKDDQQKKQRQPKQANG